MITTIPRNPAQTKRPTSVGIPTDPLKMKTLLPEVRHGRMDHWKRKTSGTNKQFRAKVRICVLEMGNRKQAYRSNMDHWVILVLCIIFCLLFIIIFACKQPCVVCFGAIKYCSTVQIYIYPWYSFLFKYSTFSKVEYSQNVAIYWRRHSNHALSRIYIHIIAYSLAQNWHRLTIAEARRDSRVRSSSCLSTAMHLFSSDGKTLKFCQERLT